MCFRAVTGDVSGGRTTFSANLAWLNEGLSLEMKAEEGLLLVGPPMP